MFGTCFDVWINCIKVDAEHLLAQPQKIIDSRKTELLFICGILGGTFSYCFRVMIF